MTDQGFLARAKLKADAKIGEHKALGAMVENANKILLLRQDSLAKQRLLIQGIPPYFEAEHPKMTDVASILESHHAAHDMYLERWVEGTATNFVNLREILEAKKALDKDKKELEKMRQKVEKAQKNVDGNKKPSKQAQLEAELDGARRDCESQEDIYSGIERATSEKCDKKLGDYLITDSEQWVAYLRSALDAAEKRHTDLVGAIRGRGAADQLLGAAGDAKNAAKAQVDAGKAKLAAMAGGGGAAAAGLGAAVAAGGGAKKADNPFDDAGGDAGNPFGGGDGGAAVSKDGHPILCKATCTTDFVAEEEGEMSISVGDVIEVFLKHDDGWWEGRKGTQEGLIPQAYLEII